MTALRRTGLAARLAGPVAIVTLLALLDQAIKALMVASLPPRVPVPVVPPLYWFLTENTGIAFSWLDFLGPWSLVVVALAVLAFVCFLWARTSADHRLAWWGFALVAGGAVGNLIDRVMLGHVTDYVLLSAGGWSFAVFNLADALITVGAIAVLADELLGWGRPKEGAGRDAR